MVNDRLFSFTIVRLGDEVYFTLKGMLFSVDTICNFTNYNDFLIHGKHISLLFIYMHTDFRIHLLLQKNDTFRFTVKSTNLLCKTVIFVIG